jgi:hypothetical protein
LALAENQSIIIAFSSEKLYGFNPPLIHVISTPSNVIGYNFDGSNYTLHAAYLLTPSELRFSNGTEVTVGWDAPEFLELDSWAFTAELWEAPTNISEASSLGSRRNATYTLNALTSWKTIQGLENASGIGYYTSQFSWPPATPNSANLSLGAYVNFAPALDSITILLNNHPVPPVDLRDPVADITEFLVNGQNTVTAIVPTTMWNYIRTLLDEVESTGIAPIFQKLGIRVPPTSDTGLIGPCNIVPYQKIQI